MRPPLDHTALTDHADAPSPVLAGFATGMAWVLPAAALLSVLLFPWIWIFAIVPGSAVGLLFALWRAYRSAARLGATGKQGIQAVLAVLAAVTVVVVPFVAWATVAS